MDNIWKVKQWCKDRDITNTHTILELIRRAVKIEKNIRLEEESRIQLKISAVIEKMLNTQPIF